MANKKTGLISLAGKIPTRKELYERVIEDGVNNYIKICRLPTSIRTKEYFRAGINWQKDQYHTDIKSINNNHSDWKAVSIVENARFQNFHQCVMSIEDYVNEKLKDYQVGILKENEILEVNTLEEVAVHFASGSKWYRECNDFNEVKSRDLESSNQNSGQIAKILLAQVNGLGSSPSRSLTRLVESYGARKISLVYARHILES